LVKEVLMKGGGGRKNGEVRNWGCGKGRFGGGRAF